MMTKGQRLLGQDLSKEEVEEFDTLDTICHNLTDFDGRVQYGNIKLIERKTHLLNKAIKIMEEKAKEAEKIRGDKYFMSVGVY